MFTVAGAAAGNGSSWIPWVLGGLAIWVGVAVALALVIGRGIRLADRRSVHADGVRTTAALDLPERVAVPAVRPRAIPVPPVGIALIVGAMALMTTGFFVRLTGATGQVAQTLSMDAPLSLPRMYVSALFAAAAVMALLGASSLPGRRTWWLAVGVIGGGIAAVKAAGTVHAGALGAVEAAVGGQVALMLSVLAAGGAVAALLFLSRSERRDRRRVVGVLALYAAASVGLSAVSAAMPTANLAAAATFVEESGEALAGVGFLLAVLAGVAPRLVLPAAWGLRRSADAHTLEVAEPLGGRRTAHDLPS